MANRFFTILVIPEKTSTVRRFVIPGWVARSLFVVLFFSGVLAVMMGLDYWYVMSQIDQNKQLKIENRRLRQEVQIFKNKVESIEDTMERVQTFATRLRIITNIEDRDGLVQQLNRKLPDAATNIGHTAAKEKLGLPGENAAQASHGQPSPQDDPLLHPDERNPENIRLWREQRELEQRFGNLNYDSLLLEQNLQDLYELLVDQKAFLGALPTRRPAIGYFTSGFGVRRSPYSGVEKMHEGLDIANHPGTPIRATAHGIVSFSGQKPGYGKLVILDHGYGLETWYGHSRTLMVQQGAKVKRGQPIASMGSSGYSTGPHVHYEVRVHGIPVDPLSYILED